jgi:hypothetical protein
MADLSTIPHGKIHSDKWLITSGLHVGSGDNKTPGRPFAFNERRRLVKRKNPGNRVLMIGRIRELALYRAAVLRDRGFEVATPETQQDAIAAIRKGGFDIAVLSYTLPE